MTDPDELPGFDEDDEERTTMLNASELGRLSDPGPANRHLLVTVQGQRPGELVVLSGDLIVGRAPSSALCLRDPSVSRRHARLLWNGQSYEVQDLGSGNGTYVNGMRVARRTLGDGDLVQFGSEIVFRFAVADDKEEAMLRHLYETSITDALTGTNNRAHLDVRLAEELSFARRHRAELAFLMIDIDHFKRVNDTFGHQAGDVVLAAVAGQIADDIRCEDILCRYGGEEFAVVLRATNLGGAAYVAERIRERVEALSVQHVGRAIRVTVSIGCTSLACCREPSAEALIGAADRRLYAAKRQGRNCVVAKG